MILAYVIKVVWFYRASQPTVIAFEQNLKLNILTNSVLRLAPKLKLPIVFAHHLAVH